jgi:hypothetical protein
MLLVKMKFTPPLLITLLIVLMPIMSGSSFSFRMEPETDFDRTEVIARLKKKIDQNQPLVIHLLVPLCDNSNQGIVPVSKTLGDGLNLRTNLYWGAGYGIKTHFKRAKAWTFIQSIPNANADVLERVIFYRKFSNGAMVYLVADAYRGDRMRKCLSDYFDALAGNKKELIQVNDTSIELYSSADLLGFNGHNGLMDGSVPSVRNTDKRAKDAVVIACGSYFYFIRKLGFSKGYPLVTTTNLLAPEAYVMEAIVNNWAAMKTDEEIRLSAGDAYQRMQKCGLNAARRLFKTGW